MWCLGSTIFLFDKAVRKQRSGEQADPQLKPLENKAGELADPQLKLLENKDQVS